MRVLGLCSYPIESAATRHRLYQFVGPLAERGIDLDVLPFLNSQQFERQYESGSFVSKLAGLANGLVKRTAQLVRSRDYDLLLVQREAMNFGPELFEALFQWVGRIPMVLDLDDATYLPYASPTFGRMVSALKFFGKTNKLIKRSRLVVCGNPEIAKYVRGLGTETIVIPTVVDQAVFSPIDRNNPRPIVGWIGTHSTFPMLESLFPVLNALSTHHSFIVRIVGAGRDKINGVDFPIDNRPWNLQREVADFQELDIGLYPLVTTSSANESWLLGKSGFKAVQYLACGVPFVMSPVGVCASIGDEGVTHFAARSESDWFASLNRLLESPELRLKMGANGRSYSLKDFDIRDQTDKLAESLRLAIQKS